MQRCADCGHSNRSGVHYCTQCGRPVVESGSSLSGPTTLVAAAVLAIGLLAFLTIRPVAGTHPTAPAPIQSAAQSATQFATHSAMQGSMHAADGSSAPVTEMPSAPVPEMPSASVSETPGLDPLLASLDANPTPSTEWRTPAASSTATSLVLQIAPALAEVPRVFDLADDGQAEAAVHSTEHRNAPGLRASSSSVAKRAAVDSSRTRGVVASVHAKPRESWRARLRAEIEACDGNFIVRTVCAERAKLRHCTAADAWGRVAECPAAQMSELATFY